MLSKYPLIHSAQRARKGSRKRDSCRPAHTNIKVSLHSPAAHAPDVRPSRADPARRGQDGEPLESRQGSAVLTDLLTTALDHYGLRGTEKSHEQDRCDRLD